MQRRTTFLRRYAWLVVDGKTVDDNTRLGVQDTITAADLAENLDDKSRRP